MLSDSSLPCIKTSDGVDFLWRHQPYWLEALRECWQVEPSDFRFTLEQVDDCHLLQFVKGSRVLTSVTWNAPDEHTHFLMPKTLDTPRHLWGNALLPDAGLLYDAFGGLNF